ncbi:MAG: HAD-IB family hydrolase [Flavobacteriaceae bacterium]|jgi:HAD superfamily hydrolase (TIGR01490 family)|nr:HAD-IB family hydrolase [Flavobacteriaceae bacterium]
MKKLYLFDFDGTLTHKDTMFLYLKFYSPSKYWVQFLKHIPLFILLKLKLADAEKVKKSFIASILKGQSQTKIEGKSKAFFEENLPSVFRQNALDFIQNMDREKSDAYIVSASLDIWVKPFAERLGIKLLSTEAEFRNGIFTGNFSTKNCNGIEKLNRIKQAISGQKFDKKIAFGDTSGDKPMLNFADESYFRFFH